MGMNDKEVKDFMLQAYRMGDFELLFALVLLRLVILAVPACIILVFTLAIFCPKQEKAAPTPQPVEMSVER